MTLLEIRTQFAEDSGRYDLVDPTTFANNGADFYINSAVRFLDRFVDTPKSIARHQEPIAIGEYRLEVIGLRSVQEVWITDTDGEKTQLELLTLTEMRTKYPDEPADIDNGKPAFVTEFTFGLAPLLLGEDPVRTVDTADLITDIDYTQAGIFWMPPADAAYTVSVFGEFYSKELSANADFNYWSQRHPEILVQATFLMTEMFLRNSAGINDALNSLNLLVRGIDFDRVSGQLAFGRQMRG